MDDLSVVDVLHSEGNLSKPVQDLGLRDGPASLFFDSKCEISSISKLHDDAKFSFFGFVNFDKLANVWMV